LKRSPSFQNAIDAARHITDPIAPWTDVLQSAAKLVGADAATILMFGSPNEMLFMEQTGVDSAAEKEYRDCFSACDALAEATFAKPSELWLDSSREKCAPEVRNHPFYADYLPRHRMAQILSFTIRDEGNIRTAMSFQRSTAVPNAIEGVASGDVGAYVRFLTNSLAKRARAITENAEIVESALHSIGEASCLATSAGRLVRCTEHARVLLALCGVLSTDRYHLDLTSTRSGLLLGSAISSHQRSGTAVPVALAAGWGQGVRFDIATAPATFRLAAELVLFIRMKKRSVFEFASSSELAAFFSLTPAEAQVLAAIIAGHAAGDYAGQEGISTITARNQLASAMRKMGCNKQSELVRLGSILR
jgi:DNA-binding CsgD family transcriptional regulator